MRSVLMALFLVATVLKVRGHMVAGVVVVLTPSGLCGHLCCSVHGWARWRGCGGLVWSSLADCEVKEGRRDGSGD